MIIVREAWQNLWWLNNSIIIISSPNISLIIYFFAFGKLISVQFNSFKLNIFLHKYERDGKNV